MLADYATAVEDLVRDKDQVLSDPQRDAAIAVAVLRYSDDRPRVLVEDVVSAGGYRLPLPTAWVPEYSRVLLVEYPIGNIPATLQDPNTVSIYVAPGGELIQLAVSLAAAEEARVSYSVQHQLTALVDTIPLRHRHAVACWAAALICDQFAANYAGDGEPTIAADTVQHGSKAEGWAKRARAYRQQYLSNVGVTERQTNTAHAQVNWNTTDSRGQQRLFPRLPK